MSRTNKNTSINVEVMPNNFKDLTKITGNLKKEYPNCQIDMIVRLLIFLYDPEKRKKRKKNF